MADQRNVTQAIDSFYEEIIDRYKELERQVASESKLLTIFRKVDYKSRIAKLKELKKKAQTINLKKIEVDQEDEFSIDARDQLGRCITIFVDLINFQVSFQTMLLKKSEGEKVQMVDYRKAVYNVQKATETLQNGLRNMDAVYANLEENQ
ncbi:hypothetical protein FRZ06_06750 [Anoxybacterium hadale]|uniref:Uncharacterized protein n=1 Tax=Anoxybacterium hadale TaxID=3408580 RepID=A0ACD1AA01_9FIRM|nr:hypothetical protein FRZ06_06750 [Clostridiales bacterium]